MNTMKFLLIVSSIFASAFADITFTSPTAGESIADTTIDVEWTDSGSPVLASYSLFLCAGGNAADSFIQLATLKDSGDPSTGKVTVTIQAGVGGTTANAYFLKMIGAATGGTIINYSKRFSLTGMTGSFAQPQVVAGLATVTGTDGPANVNNVVTVAGQQATSAAGTAGFDVPYSMQTGAIRYAPMPPIPGSKISAKAASAQYPTSSYNLYTTYGGAPAASTTITQPLTSTFSGFEATISAAANPMDADMQKFLKRWRD